MNALHAGRNDACPCGSGKKFKRCCLPVQTLLEERGGVPLVPSFDAAAATANQQPAQPKPHGVPPWFVEESENRVLKTTAEHPFYVYGKGWTPACEIKDGDLIRTDIGWVTINGTTDTGRYEAVYNVRVADCHTYFVGAEGWGFGVWAHNAACLDIDRDARHGLDDHHDAMNAEAAAYLRGRQHPDMPLGVVPATRTTGPTREVRTNQGALDPVNPDGPALRTSTGEILRPDVQVLGTDGRVYVTEVTRYLPNGQVNVIYHQNREAELQAVYGSAWGGYKPIDI